MTVMLEVEKVAKYFGGVKALDGVSLNVKRGSIIGLIGPNGSGKTTLFNVITGFYEPTKGEVWFEGERIDGLNPNEIYKKGIVRTFQIPKLFQSLSVLENVLLTPPNQLGEKPFVAPFRKKWSEQEVILAKRAVDLLNMFDLKPYVRSKVSELSAAHIKLLETIRGIMGNAKLLLLDEPAAGVAYTTAKEMFEFIVRLRNEAGLTFFIIEHRLEVLMDYVEYVYVLHNGKLLSEGKPEEVMQDKKVIEAYIGE
jgi:branched-chain amino acid transport system ATP-binding protein